MNGLTPRQQQVLDYLRSCKQTPTYREIARHMGGTCAGSIARIIRVLETTGFIVRIPGKTQSLRIIDPDITRFSTADLARELSNRLEKIA